MSYLESEYDDLDKYKDDLGDIYYYKKDTQLIHNPYGPAIIYKDGSKFYYIENKAHRLDGAAIIYKNGVEIYIINNQYLSKEKFELHPDRLKYLGKEYLLCLK